MFSSPSASVFLSAWNCQPGAVRRNGGRHTNSGMNQMSPSVRHLCPAGVCPYGCIVGRYPRWVLFCLLPYIHLEQARRVFRRHSHGRYRWKNRNHIRPSLNTVLHMISLSREQEAHIGATYGILAEHAVHYQRGSCAKQPLDFWAGGQEYRLKPWNLCFEPEADMCKK